MSQELRAALTQAMQRAGLRHQREWAEAAEMHECLITYLFRGALPEKPEEIQRLASAILLTPQELIRLMHGALVRSLEAKLQEYQPQLVEEQAANQLGGKRWN